MPETVNAFNATPNPESLKFLAGRPVSPERSFTVDRARAREYSLPAALIYERFHEVGEIMLGADSVTVSVKRPSDWTIPVEASTLRDKIEAALRFFNEKKGDFVRALPPGMVAEAAPGDRTVAAIRELIDTRVRPAIAGDGGDITFLHFDRNDGTVYVNLIGSCRTCPSLATTLQGGVETLLKHFVPEVRAVRNIEPETASRRFNLSFSRGAAPV